MKDVFGFNPITFKILHNLLEKKTRYALGKELEIADETLRYHFNELLKRKLILKEEGGYIINKNHVYVHNGAVFIKEDSGIILLGKRGSELEKFFTRHAK